ncbi:Cytochrome P450 3A6 [Exaiptasia diaphana]|nr:Cytochrome P450 3A6 [Exaiptasia diaphana]
MVVFVMVNVVIADPDLIKQIMTKDSHLFTNHHQHFPIAKERKGMFFLKDEDWKRVRSVLSPTFTTGKLKLMVPAIERSNETLMSKLQGIADTVTRLLLISPSLLRVYIGSPILPMIMPRDINEKLPP